MLRELRTSVVIFVLLSVLTGLVYPAVTTIVGRVVFPAQSQGSLLNVKGRGVGSALLGQSFSSAGYFWSRPSATATNAYNAAASSGSNQGPTNPALVTAVADRVNALRAADPGNTQPIPVDLVTASASGLDPHITPAAAEYQVARVARARKLSVAQVRELVVAHTEKRTFGILGEPRVNVLEVNLALDAVR
jgi:potassium-transporting ATPase KdpC subunit